MRPIDWLRVQGMRLPAYCGERLARGSYAPLDEQRLRRARRSDTVFVFGSGASLNDITGEAWRAISAHDTLGMNYFVHQQFVRVDFHVIGELATGDDFDATRWRPALAEYLSLLRSSPFYESTILGLQQGWRAVQSNRILASGMLAPGRPIFRYRRISRGKFRPPSESLRAGLVHGAGTVVSCVNLAYLLGWTVIVLAGVDLYDSRYFWLPPEETRADGLSYNIRPPQAPHVQAQPLVDYLARWTPLLRSRGVRLTVLNPRSLLARVMPVYAA